MHIAFFYLNFEQKLKEKEDENGISPSKQ